MSTGFFKVPKAKNEIVKSYRPGSPERKEVIETYQKMISSVTEVPMYINGKDVKSKSKKNISPPHDHQTLVGEYYLAVIIVSMASQEDVTTMVIVQVVLVELLPFLIG